MERSPLGVHACIIGPWGAVVRTHVPTYACTHARTYPSLVHSFIHASFKHRTTEAHKRRAVACTHLRRPPDQPHMQGSRGRNGIARGREGAAAPVAVPGTATAATIAEAIAAAATATATAAQQHRQPASGVDLSNEWARHRCGSSLDSFASSQPESPILEEPYTSHTHMCAHTYIHTHIRTSAHTYIRTDFQTRIIVA
eukprot:GHVU01143649.1.p1 GENE.GHVU01143649.1~~GHVU01143649.1.p1  ORF type:complete len:198 (+),score=15.85 GHVU01143649.1:163-756(+)